MGQLSELDKLYSPSEWSKRGNAEFVIQKHIELASQESERARQIVPCELNVPYGELEEEKYDLYGTDLPSDAPIFIYIHGGYWQELNKDISGYMVAPLYKNEIKVAIMDYTLCPKVKVLDIMKQTQRAVRKIITYAEEHGAKCISIAGHSAGAQLAISLFSDVLDGPILKSPLIKSVHLISGVYDLIPLVDTYCNAALKMDKKEAKILSPQRQSFAADDVKAVFNVIVGMNDSPAFVEQSKTFYMKLKDVFKTNLELHENLDHFDIVEMLNKDDFVITTAIINDLKK